jgi:transposase
MIQGFQMEALMARFDLTDAEWSIIAPLLPGAEGRKNSRPGRTIARFSTASSSCCVLVALA